MKGSVNLTTSAPLQAGQQTTIKVQVVFTGGGISSSASVDALALAASITSEQGSMVDCWS
jgi:acid phosphatase family membrane protein YuiD